METKGSPLLLSLPLTKSARGPIPNGQTFQEAVWSKGE